MIIFTITNTITEQVYVGRTQHGSSERWNQIKAALPLGIDSPLYNDMREHGASHFSLSEWGFANDREELREMMVEAMEEFNAISLQGLKTALPTVKVIPTATKKVKTVKAKSTNITKKAATSITEKPKLATGRTGSSIKEKNIREAIAREKADRLEKKSRQIAAEADEMKAIMAKMDARMTGAAKRR